MANDRDYWERLWDKTLREHPDKVAQRPPNAYLIAELGGLRPGRALDAGCGHGAETLWLAGHGWSGGRDGAAPGERGRARRFPIERHVRSGLVAMGRVLPDQTEQVALNERDHVTHRR